MWNVHQKWISVKFKCVQTVLAVIHLHVAPSDIMVLELPPCPPLDSEKYSTDLFPILYVGRRPPRYFVND